MSEGRHPQGAIRSYNLLEAQVKGGRGWFWYPQEGTDLFQDATRQG